MDEAKFRESQIRHSAWGTLSTTIATAIATGLGLFYFLSGQKANIDLESEKRKDEIALESSKRRSDAEYAFEKERAQRRLDEYVKIAELMGQLAAARPSDLDSLRRRFLSRYWGMMILTPYDQKVDAVLLDYKNHLMDLDPFSTDDMRELKQNTDTTITVLRDSIEADKKRLVPR